MADDERMGDLVRLDSYDPDTSVLPLPMMPMGSVAAPAGREADFLSWLGLSSPTTYSAPKDTSWPGEQEQANSFKVDQTYGRDIAGYLAPEARVHIAPIADVPGIYDQTAAINLARDAPLRNITPAQSEQLHRQWLAAQRSPVAALGYDPRRFFSSPPSDQKLNVAGFYVPAEDVGYYDQNYETSGVHEATHRGMEMLKKAGLLPKGLPDNETAVRMLMLRHFNEIEKRPGADKGNKQVDFAKGMTGGMFDKPLTALEAAAANLIAKRHPMGPN